MKKNKYPQALNSFIRLRNSRVQACRDLYFAHCLLVEENQITRGKFPFLELFTIPRNARATLASTINMFGQQVCVMFKLLEKERVSWGEVQILALTRSPSLSFPLYSTSSVV